MADEYAKMMWQEDGVWKWAGACDKCKRYSACTQIRLSAGPRWRCADCVEETKEAQRASKGWDDGGQGMGKGEQEIFEGKGKGKGAQEIFEGMGKGKGMSETISPEKLKDIQISFTTYMSEQMKAALHDAYDAGYVDGQIAVARSHGHSQPSDARSHDHSQPRDARRHDPSRRKDARSRSPGRR
jgi:hypothetical protein